MIVALTLPHSAADAVADQAYIKPEYYVLLLIASGEAILTGLALAVLAVFRPYSVGAIRILLAVTAALAVLLVAGSAATLLAYHTTGVG